MIVLQTRKIAILALALDQSGSADTSICSLPWSDDGDRSSHACYYSGPFIAGATGSSNGIYKYPESSLKDPCQQGKTKGQIKDAIANILSYSAPLCSNKLTMGQHAAMFKYAQSLRGLEPTCSSS